MSLPPGFRFHPTDVELIKYYLKRKSLGKKLRLEVIAEVDVYKYSPWDLPDKSYLKNKDLEWFFFCPVSRKYASGARLSRATETGYWKSTGKDRTVRYNEEIVGMIKTLIFHQGHAPKGDRTDWVMHEYRILETELGDGGVDQAPYVLVKVFKKNGLGPQNGAQYGAPFNENEWDSDYDVEMCAEVIPSSTSIPLSAVANHNSVVTNTFIHSNTSAASQLPPVYSSPSAFAHNNSYSVVTPTQSESVPPTAETHNYNSVITSSFFQGSMSIEPLPVPGPSTTTLQANVVMPAVGDEVDLEAMLAMFDPDVPPNVPSNSNINQVNGEDFIELDDIYAGLDDLANWEELSQLLK